MYKKFIKQKLLGRRPWVVALTAVVVFSSFSSLFGLATPASPYLEQVGLEAPKVYAQSAEQRAVQYCAGKEDRDRCQKKFVEGFNASPAVVASCTNLEFAVCPQAYLAGAQARSGKPLPSFETRVEAREACKDGKNQLAKDACATGYQAAIDGRSKEEACGGARDKKACQAGYDRGKEAGTGGEESEEEGPGGLADCDAKTDSPLSWIICPIIDLGANLTDFMFQKIVNPLLSDVPVSDERGDPVYKTWQGFRLIANLMLVVSMLAIVYAQTRGGGQ